MADALWLAGHAALFDTGAAAETADHKGLTAEDHAKKHGQGAVLRAIREVSAAKRKRDDAGAGAGDGAAAGTGVGKGAGKGAGADKGAGKGTGAGKAAGAAPPPPPPPPSQGPSRQGRA